MVNPAEAGLHERKQPTRWLVDHARMLPRSGDALDIACGTGRNALWLAGRGLNTVAVDRNASAIAELREAAGRLRLPVSTEVVDLESDGWPLPVSAFDVVVVVHYLHRPLFPALKAALRPGGILVYETFTRAQAWRGKPTNPAFLLDPGELHALVAPLDVLDEREGDFEGKMLAGVIATRRSDRGQERR